MKLLTKIATLKSTARDPIQAARIVFAIAMTAVVAAGAFFAIRLLIRFYG